MAKKKMVKNVAEYLPEPEPEPEPIPEPEPAPEPEPVFEPEISPYTTSTYTFIFGPNCRAYYVPEAFLQNSGLINSADSWNRQIVEPDVDEDTGHVLVHYLYTGAYQTLKNVVVAPGEENIVEFGRAALAYIAATKFSLHGLQELAKEQIEILGTGMSVFQTVDAVKNKFSKLLKEDVWFLGYVEQKVKLAFEEDYKMFEKEELFDGIEDIALTRLLARWVVGLYGKKVERMVEVLVEEVVVAEDCLATETTVDEWPVEELAPVEEPVAVEELAPVEEPVAVEDPIPAEEPVPEPAPEYIELERAFGAEAIPSEVIVKKRSKKEQLLERKRKLREARAARELQEFQEAQAPPPGEPASEPAPEPAPEPVPEPAPAEEAYDSWGFTSSKKKKGKKAVKPVEELPPPPPEPEAEPVAEQFPAHSLWGSWGIKEAPPPPPPEPEVEPAIEYVSTSAAHSVWPASWGTTTTKKKKTKKSAATLEVLRPPVEAVSEPVPVPEFDFGPEPVPEAEPQLKEEEKNPEDDHWGFSFGTATKKKKQKKSAAIAEPPPMPEPEPEAVPAPEPARDDPWANWGFSTSQKKGAVCTSPWGDPPPPSAPEPEPEPASREDNWGSIWGASLAKKGKKGKERAVEEIKEQPVMEEPPPPLVEEPAPAEDDGWGSFGTITTKKKKGKKGKVALEAPEEQPPPPVEEPAPVEDDGWGSFGTTTTTTTKKKKGKKGKGDPEPPEEPPQPPVEEPAPVEDDGWGSFGTTTATKKKKGKKGKVAPEPPQEPVVQYDPVLTPEPKPSAVVENENRPVASETEICSARARHLLVWNEWMNCGRCRAKMCQVAVQIARADHSDSDGYEIVDRGLLK